MKSLRDEDLILYYYGEATNAAEIEGRLAGSEQEQARFESLRRVLDAVEVPEPPERLSSYGAMVWQKIEPEIERVRSRSSLWQNLQPRREWALTAAMLLLIVVAFLVGRNWPAEQSQIAGADSGIQDRILLMTVAGHLDRSEMLLLELVNSNDEGELDLTIERRMATELSSENRLYRQAAAQSGRTDVVALLDQLERVLIDLANGSDQGAPGELGELRVRLEEGDLLFKVRIVGSKLRQQELRKDEIGGEAAAVSDV